MATRTVEVKGGDKLAKKLAEIAHALGTGTTSLSVGFLSDADYPDTEGKKGGLKVAQNAFWQEFGTSRIPARPFFRNMIAEKSPTWGRALALNLKNNRYDVTDALTAMGHGIKDQLVESILATNSPPNAPSTIRRKKHKNSKPLVDTGLMLGKVDFVVEEA